MSHRAVRIAMVAGEASGDQLASHLICALRVKLPNAEFFGIGGPKMEGQGFKAISASDEKPRRFSPSALIP